MNQELLDVREFVVQECRKLIEKISSLESYVVKGMELTLDLRRDVNELAVDHRNLHRKVRDLQVKMQALSQSADLTRDLDPCPICGKNRRDS